MRLLFFLFVFVLIGCQQPKFKSEWTHEPSPEQFTAKFETTKGDFTIEVTRNLSPKAADRFYQLVKHGYFDQAIFYRVVKDFVAQFGNTDTLVMNQWRKIKIADEPVLMGNQKGTVSFARDGKETRDLDLFINLNDNTALDTINYQGIKGFPAFGKVTSGMENVEKLYSGYSEVPMADENLYLNRTAFYKTFPKLDLIKKAYIVE